MISFSWWGRNKKDYLKCLPVYITNSRYGTVPYPHCFGFIGVLVGFEFSSFMLCRWGPRFMWKENVTCLCSYGIFTFKLILIWYYLLVLGRYGTVPTVPSKVKIRISKKFYKFLKFSATWFRPGPNTCSAFSNAVAVDQILIHWSSGAGTSLPLFLYNFVPYII